MTTSAGVLTDLVLDAWAIMAWLKGQQPAGERVIQVIRPRITTVSASDQLVMDAAKLKTEHPISYADALAAATAISRKKLRS